MFAPGAVFPIGGRPVPAGRRARARRCRTASGTRCCGERAAKQAQASGWRRHLIRTAAGVPVARDLLPGGRHDLPPGEELAVEHAVDGFDAANRVRVTDRAGVLVREATFLSTYYPSRNVVQVGMPADVALT